MIPQELLDEAARRGIYLFLDGQTVRYRGPKAALAELMPKLAAHKGELLAQLRAAKAAVPAALTQPVPRPAWTTACTPNSRSPLIPNSVRAKIEAIEQDARAKGWPAELLWNANFSDAPRGLAAVLNDGDEIGDVTGDYIEILKSRRDLLKFRRCHG